MAADYNNSKKYRKFKISEVVKPVTGKTCICNHYWIVTPDDCILLYEKCSWQCNAQEIIAKKVLETTYPDCTVEYFDALYVSRLEE